MANRYWVGGAGTWNTSSTTNWSASSGGATGASAPTSADAVFFDANSGSGTVTVSGGTCFSFNATGFTGTFSSGSITVGVYSTSGGNINLGSCVYNSVNITWHGQGTRTISSGSVPTSGKVTIIVGYSTIQSVINQTSAIDRQLSIINNNATWNTNNHQLGSSTNSSSSQNSLSSFDYYDGSVNLGSSTVYFNTVSGKISGGTSTLFCETLDANMAGNTYYNVNLQFNQLNCTANCSFVNLTLNTDQGRAPMEITPGVTVTVSGNITNNNAGINNYLVIKSIAYDTKKGTLNLTGTRTLSYVWFENITVTGGTLSGTELIDCGGNSGITFVSSRNLYRVPTGFALSSGGTSVTTFTRPSDNVYYDANSGSTVGNSYYAKGHDYTGWTGVLNTFMSFGGAVVISSTVTEGESGGRVRVKIAGSGGNRSLTTGGKSINLELECSNAANITFQDNFTGSISVGVNKMLSQYNSITVNRDSYLMNINTNDKTVTLSYFYSYPYTKLNLGSSVLTINPTQSNHVYMACAVDGGTSTVKINPQTTNLTLNFKTGGKNRQLFNILEFTGSTTGVTYSIGENQQDYTSFTANEFKVTHTSPVTIKFAYYQYTNDEFSFGKWTVVGSAGNVITIGSRTTGQKNKLVYTGIDIVQSDYISVSDSTAEPSFTWYAGKNSTLSNTTGWVLGEPSFGNGLFFGSNF